MSLLPNSLSAYWRKADSDPAPEPDTDSRGDNVFGLIPPDGANAAEPTIEAEAEAVTETKPTDAPGGRNVQPIAMADLSRLSIDNDGRLYWDGKPVEVRRRILMSRAQIIGASVIGAFVIIGAVGAAVHGSLAARDWACRFGWTENYCGVPVPPARIPDIPA